MAGYIPIDEGLDHINIYSKSRLLLGRMLSNFYTCHLDLPNHGKFSSVEGYWYWLKTGDDRLRTLSGYAAKSLGKSLEVTREEPNFSNLICTALNYKIKQNESIRLELINSTLPLTHYYWYGDINEPKIVRLSKYDWITEHLELIRKTLKNKKLN